MNNKNNYPFIFVHGMFGWGENEGINKIIPYWGATAGSLTDYISGMGLECHAASVGPISSAWDQACELYAQLTGTTVDYGEAHSKKFGHARFGRKYTKPLFEGWSSEKKVHLIGHSFGGNAIRMLTHLLTYGAEDEISASGNDISPLFIGGKEDLVCSVTAICSPLNGTGAYEAAQRIKLITPLVRIAYTYAGFFGRSHLNGKLVDFHLEQFGLTDSPDARNRSPIGKSIKKITQTKDNIEHDMSPEGAKIMNERIQISPSVYYFSYPFDAIKKYKNGALSVPAYTDFFLMFITSTLMLKNAAYDERKLHKQADFNNDGLVNISSASHPLNEPFHSFNGEAKAGIWNVMPATKGDHGTAIGLFADKTRTRKFYVEMIERLQNAEKQAENSLK